MKKCKDCNQVKSLKEDFHKAGKYFQVMCKSCHQIRKRIWESKNPDKARFIKAKSKLGINEEDFERINKIKSCDICGVVKKSLHIDHDHKTAKFRGALCANCNLGLGKFQNSIVFLKNAINYLEKYK